jgi:hypothetical protein
MTVNEYSNSKIEHYIGTDKYSEKYFNRINIEFDALRHLFRNNLHISEFTYNYWLSNFFLLFINFLQYWISYTIEFP